MKTKLESEMGSNPAADLNDELRPEYTAADFKRKVRGKYAGQFSEETRMVVLAPDVADAYPTADSVNAALRTLMQRDANQKQTVEKTTVSAA